MTTQTKSAVRIDELDKVVGGSTHQQGTDASETFTGDAGDNIVHAGGGSDDIIGNGGNDQAYGGAGDDYISGGAGNDLAFGGDGGDVIVGGAGADQSYGEAGNDLIIGADGDRTADLAYGGAGDDTYIWSPGSGNDQFHGEAGKDTLNLAGVTLDQLNAGLQTYGGGLEMAVTSTGQVSFHDANGQPQSFSGQFTLNGETVQFFNVERLQIKF